MIKDIQDHEYYAITGAKLRRLLEIASKLTCDGIPLKPGERRDLGQEMYAKLHTAEGPIKE